MLRLWHAQWFFAPTRLLSAGGIGPMCEDARNYGVCQLTGQILPICNNIDVIMRDYLIHTLQAIINWQVNIIDTDTRSVETNTKTKHQSSEQAK